ncbi:hypothetical protein BN8_06282 [Fibrisoma limi BUZ 3]|uniref:Uncharacterized protein n=1 Tax=Fibrisoma limi BUZ 3 TaxID=1185876 RepID=I2GSL3_9BACT|nr:hypothetical protein BN8_06282 [Fibrisoma limi BUZ 3]
MSVFKLLLVAQFELHKLEMKRALRLVYSLQKYDLILKADELINMPAEVTRVEEVTFLIGVRIRIKRPILFGRSAKKA